MLFDIVLYKKLPSSGLDTALRSDVRRLAVVGPPGSGKNLTLQLLAGLLKPDGGRIRVNSGTWFDEWINLPAQKCRVGLLFQGYALFPHLTVVQNIDFGLVRGLPNPLKGLSEKARYWLGIFRLERVTGYYPQQVSDGQERHTALTRALVTELELLLLDESFSALDADLRTYTRNEVLQTQQASGIPTILITHDRADVEVLADEVWTMEAGRLAAAGIDAGQCGLRSYKPRGCLRKFFRRS